MIIVFITLLLLQGCADILLRTAFNWGSTVKLKNNEGNIVDCTVSKSSAVFKGRRDRDRKIEQCVLAYEKQGYKRIN